MKATAMRGSVGSTSGLRERGGAPAAGAQPVAIVAAVAGDRLEPAVSVDGRYIVTSRSWLGRSAAHRHLVASLVPLGQVRRSRRPRSVRPRLSVVVLVALAPQEHRLDELDLRRE